MHTHLLVCGVNKVVERVCLDDVLELAVLGARVHVVDLSLDA
jgi:hypothetical protein